MSRVPANVRKLQSENEAISNAKAYAATLRLGNNTAAWHGRDFQVGICKHPNSPAASHLRVPDGIHAHVCVFVCACVCACVCVCVCVCFVCMCAYACTHKCV